EYNLIKRREAELAAPIGRMEGVGPKMEARLVEHDIVSVQKLAECTIEDLIEIEGIGETTAESMITRAREMSRQIEREYIAQQREIAAQEAAEKAAAAQDGQATDETGIFRQDFDDSDEDDEETEEEEAELRD
ncbi:MAG TPA: helix-hairpin-helix domain-containing protein, partial [candidate division Zixibacteria bacterium]|nr:helix-hairpin-helix domain-containing protein [candidate division Zixibacteria bacterium]